MKKLLITILLLAVSSLAVALKLQMYFGGAYESTPVYRTIPIAGTTTRTTTVVTRPSGSYVYISESPSTPGVLPESAPTYWTAL